MSKEKKKTDPVVVLLDLVIVVLFYVMIMVGMFLYQNISFEKETGSFAQDATRMSYDLQKNDFSSLIQGAYINKINNHNDTEMYHKLAEYTEAAFMYKVYDEKGQVAEADRQKEIMDSSRKTMGNMTVFADKVDEMIRDFGKNK